MVGARLSVERGTVRDRTQDWGAFEFVALPSPGDRVAVHHEDATHFLTVLCVHHRPVRIGGAPAADPPTAEVVAKWTGAE